MIVATKMTHCLLIVLTFSSEMHSDCNSELKKSRTQRRESATTGHGRTDRIVMFDDRGR